MVTNSHNRSLVIILAAVIFISLIFVLGYLTLFRSTSNRSASGNDIGCNDNAGMVFCISTTTSPKTLKAEITNNTDRTYIGNFTSTCTEPSLIIDGEVQNTIRACGAALTSVEIKPGETQAYQLQIPEKFNSKTITASAKWEKLISGEVKVQLP